MHSGIGSPRERYRDDPVFRTVVEMFCRILDSCELTTAEIRAALFTAMVLQEERNPHWSTIRLEKYAEELLADSRKHENGR